MPGQNKGGSPKSPTGKARSAITRRYVSPKYAKTHPKTTVVEHSKKE